MTFKQDQVLDDQFNQGKFTFEPNQKQPIHQFAAGHEIVDAGISFGGAHRLDNGSTNMSFSGNDISNKNMKSFHQSRNDGAAGNDDDAQNDNIIKEQSVEEEDI